MKFRARRVSHHPEPESVDLPLSQSSIKSGDTVPPPVVNWNCYTKPKGLVETVSAFPKGKVARQVYCQIYDTIATAIQTNTAIALGLYDTLVDKCVLGKKQESAKKALTVTSSSLTTSTNDKRIFKLEKQNLNLQIDNAKDKARTAEKSAKELKKELDNIKKELLQAQKDLVKEKDKWVDLSRRYYKIVVQNKELADSKKKLEVKLKKYENVDFQQQQYKNCLAAKASAKQKEREDKDSRRLHGQQVPDIIQVVEICPPFDNTNTVMTMTMSPIRLKSIVGGRRVRTIGGGVAKP